MDTRAETIHGMLARLHARQAQARQYAEWHNGVAQGLSEQYGLTCAETGLDYANLYRHGVGMADAVVRGAMNHLALAMALDVAPFGWAYAGD